MWFSVATLMKSAVDGAEAFWEESIFLVEASSDEEAKARARDLALKRENDYKSLSGESIAWRFDSIIQCYEIDEALSSGVEIFSMFLRKSEAQSLKRPFEDNEGGA